MRAQNMLEYDEAMFFIEWLRKKAIEADKRSATPVESYSESGKMQRLLRIASEIYEDFKYPIP